MTTGAPQARAAWVLLGIVLAKAGSSDRDTSCASAKAYSWPICVTGRRSRNRTLSAPQSATSRRNGSSATPDPSSTSWKSG